MKLKIKKLKELPDAMYPNNIEEGFEREVEIPDWFFSVPKVGERFHVGFFWSTSMVVEILSESTFKTTSSIYRWEAIG